MPNAALRYFPDKTLVRDEDQKLLELNLSPEPDDETATSSETPPVDDIATATIASSKRIVWIQEAFADRPMTTDEKSSSVGSTDSSASDPSTALTGKLRAIHIEIGDSDYQFTQVLSGELQAGDELITGVKPPGAP